MKRRHSIDELRTVLGLDPELGRFRWLIHSIRMPLGSIAGTSGAFKRRQIQYDKVIYREHVLVWAFTHNEWPSKDIDHINGNADDNRPENLRLATVSQNIANSKLSAANTSGFKGVFKKRGRWAATITHKYKLHYLGSFDTPEQAHEAYWKAAKAFFGEYARAA